MRKIITKATLKAMQAKALLKSTKGENLLGEIYDSKKSKNSGAMYLLSQKIAFGKTELTSGEPCTPRGVSTVRGRVFGNLSQ